MLSVCVYMCVCAREGRADLQCVRQQGQPIPGEVLAF